MVSCANCVVVESMTDLLEGGRAILSTSGRRAADAGVATAEFDPQLTERSPVRFPLPPLEVETAEGTTIVSAAVKAPWFMLLAAEVTAGISEGRTSMML